MSQSENRPVAVAAVVADTHVPDRITGLHPDLVAGLEALRPDVILHAGDVCSQPVLDRLGQIAPVYAVRGNRDWFSVAKLPNQQTVDLAGVQITVLHGHGGLADYLKDKLAYLLRGYRFERYVKLMRPSIGDARVVVFGHTHRPVMQTCENVIYFNPGSATVPPPGGSYPSYGILKIYPHGIVQGEFVRLGGYKARHRKWVKIQEFS